MAGGGQDRLIRLLDNFYTAIFERRPRRKNVILKDVAIIQDTITLAELTNTPAIENPVAAYAYDDLTVVNGNPSTDPSIYEFNSVEANRVQYGSSVCDETTMVLVFRVRTDYASSTAGTHVLYDWKDSGNERIVVWFSGGNWRVRRYTSGAGNDHNAVDTFSSGDKRTITIVLTATTVGIAIDNGSIATTGNTTIPTLAAAQFDVGSDSGAANWFEGGVLWMLIGKGTISNSDIDTIHAIGDSDPRFTVLDDFNRTLDNYLDSNIDADRDATADLTPLDIVLDVHMDDSFGTMTEYAGYDGSAPNPSGFVVVGAGARGGAALEDGGYGSMQFDGALSRVIFAADDWINNIWTKAHTIGLGGGWFIIACTVQSDGGGNEGRLITKAQYRLYFTDEAAGLVRLEFDTYWSGTDGQWQSPVDIPIASDLILIGVVYDGDNVANHPTIYEYDSTNDFRRLTNGDGLTQSVGPPTGAIFADDASPFIIGNNGGINRAYHGSIGRTLVGLGTPTEAEMRGMMSRMIPRSVSSGSDVLHDFPDLDLSFLWYGEDATHEPLTSRAGECNVAA